MKPIYCTLGLLVMLAAFACADDMKTLSGQVYSNIVIQQYDPDGLLVIHDDGSTTVPFADIAPGLRNHYKALSLIPVSRTRLGGEKEKPAGEADLETISGQIFRNVTVRSLEEDRVNIAHDLGFDTVFLATLSDPMRAKVSSFPKKPDAPIGANDIVTTYGLVFRNTAITQAEPDGLTFTHDGGLTKLGFPALPIETCEEYNYDPIAAWKYSRESAAKKRELMEGDKVEEKPNGPATYMVFAVETEKITQDNKFWVRFSVKNLTRQPLSISVDPCNKSLQAIAAGKTITVEPLASKELQQFVIPNVAPDYLKFETPAYWTNTALTWE